MDTTASTTGQKTAKSGGARYRGSVQPALYGMRRSCDACGRRKKKCDGERPCRRCAEHGEECTHSKRKWHLPQPQQNQQRQQQPRGSSTHPRQIHLNTAYGAPPTCRMLPFKRCRLGASPATGLVGMQENGFLSDFFGCVGFLPLATHSHIRESMVKLMVTPVQRQQPTCGVDRGEGGQVDDIAEGGKLDESLSGRDLLMDPSTCTFWCAVALGALARGSPLQSVVNYTQLATEALASSSSGPSSAEVAKALAILAYLYGFMGDQAKFQEHLVRAEACYTASVQRGSSDIIPMGFAELIKSADIMYFDWLESSGVRPLSPPQLSGAAGEPEMYRYVMQSYQIFEQVVASKMVPSAADRGSLGGAEPAGQGTRDPPDPQDLADAMGAAWDVVDFEPLEELVERSSIGGGFGGMIITATLVLEAASTGDVHATLERTGRCVDVFERYPGLCRSVMGCHAAHMVLAALTGLEGSSAREDYERLRTAYNSCRAHGSSPVPPLEEWRGMSSICEDLSCRAYERLMASENMRAFLIPSDGYNSKEGGWNEAEKVLDPREQEKGEFVPARMAGEEKVPDPAPFCSEATGAWFDPSMSRTCDAPRCSAEVGHAGAGRWMGPAVAATTSTSSVEYQLHPINCHSVTEPSEQDGASIKVDAAHGRSVGGCSVVGGATDCPKTSLMMQEVLTEGIVEDAEDHELGAADWLDVTHALLDEDHGPAQTLL